MTPRLTPTYPPPCAFAVSTTGGTYFMSPSMFRTVMKPVCLFEWEKGASSEVTGGDADLDGRGESENDVCDAGAREFARVTAATSDAVP